MPGEDRRISAKPLFDRLDKAKGEASKLAGDLRISHGRLANWRKRGIPAASLPDVAPRIGMTVDQYLVAAGRPRAALAQQEGAQYTIEAQALMDDFYALPQGLQEHIARKAAELRQYADALPKFIRDSLKPPSDPAALKAWERDIEADMLRRLAEAAPIQAPTAKKRR